jgi:hypothetical protein
MRRRGASGRPTQRALAADSADDDVQLADQLTARFMQVMYDGRTPRRTLTWLSSG